MRFLCVSVHVWCVSVNVLCVYVRVLCVSFAFLFVYCVFPVRVIFLYVPVYVCALPVRLPCASCASIVRGLCVFLCISCVYVGLVCVSRVFHMCFLCVYIGM